MFSLGMGDFEDDPFFGTHMQSMQRMNSMVNSMFADFGMMGPPMIGHGQMGQQDNRMLPMGGMQMMPFGFPPMPSIGSMFSNLENMGQNPNCHSFTSSSIMTMTSSPDGRPQVYQESMSTRSGPGGIKETKKTVSDSRTGTRKMAIGHHIGERAHIIEREHNMHSGDQEEHQEFINLEEEEADSFNREWETKSKRTPNAIGAPNYRSHRGHDQEPRQLALPSSSVGRAAESTCTSGASTSTTETTTKESPIRNNTTAPSRKREHSPDVEEIIDGGRSKSSSSSKRHSSGASPSRSSPSASTAASSASATVAAAEPPAERSQN